MDKKLLNERDICTKFITPALRHAGWDEISQMREEVRFTKGRIIDFMFLVQRMKPDILRLVQRSTHGTCKLLTDDLFSLPLPIPPLAEQRRPTGWMS